MNDLLNNYGCGLSEKELEKLNNLFLKLETGKCEIIEFQETLCKINTEKLQQELQRKDNEIKQLREDIVNHIKIASEYKEQMIIKDNIINELKQNKRDYERENILEMKLHILDNNWNELKNYVDKLYESETYHSMGEVLDKIDELEKGI